MRVLNRVPWRGLAALTLVTFVALAGRSDEDRVSSFGEGFREPSALAVVGDGSVAVADAAADAVLLLDPEGRRIWVQDEELDHPLGLGAGQGRIWVADTGHHRVVALTLDEGRVAEIVELEPPREPTDVAVAADGALWVSISADDLLLRIPRDGGPILEITEVDGEPLAAPRGLVADGHGGVFVAEALAGHVRHLDARGDSIAVLGKLGVGEARLAKPKDVTLLADGSLAVLDTQLGVIQILDQQGTFLRMLADEAGPIQFDHPLGLGVLGDRLLVADAARGGISILPLDGDDLGPGEIPHPATLLRRERGALGNDDPSALCRQCHDGTRRRDLGNWDPMLHQHPLDMAGGVPEGLSVTRRGDLRCATCHSIHGTDQDTQQTVTQGHCEECHGEIVPDRARRSHALARPLGPSWNVEALRGHRAELSDEITCLTCHSPHGAPHEPLLVMSRDDGELCAACHDLRSADGHPLAEEPGALPRTAIVAAGGVLGSQGQTTCLSCHDVHGASGGALLRFSGGAAASCEACHERAEHGPDWHPDESCVECHSMHERALLDGESCAECHEEEQAARDAGGHGNATCLDCHPATGDPPQAHDLPEDTNPASHRCLACHATGADAMEAPRIARFDHPSREIIPPAHAAEQLPLFSADGAQLPPGEVGEFSCLSCHVFHGPAPGATARKLRRNVWKTTCSTCHGADALIRYTYFHQPGRGLE